MSEQPPPNPALAHFVSELKALLAQHDIPWKDSYFKPATGSDLPGIAPSSPRTPLVINVEAENTHAKKVRHSTPVASLTIDANFAETLDFLPYFIQLIQSHQSMVAPVFNTSVNAAYSNLEFLPDAFEEVVTRVYNLKNEWRP